MTLVAHRRHSGTAMFADATSATPKRWSGPPRKESSTRSAESWSISSAKVANRAPALPISGSEDPTMRSRIGLNSAKLSASLSSIKYWTCRVASKPRLGKVHVPEEAHREHRIVESNCTERCSDPRQY